MSSNQLRLALSEEEGEPPSSSTVDRQRISKLYIDKVMASSAAEAARRVVNSGTPEGPRTLELNLVSSPSEAGFYKNQEIATQKSEEQKLHILLTTEEESADLHQEFHPVVCIEDQADEQPLSDSRFQGTRQVGCFEQPFGEEKSSSSSVNSSGEDESDSSKRTFRRRSSASSGVIAIVQRDSTAYVERLIKTSQQVGKVWAPPTAPLFAAGEPDSYNQVSHMQSSSFKAQRALDVFAGEIPEEKHKRQLASASNSRSPLLEARKPKAFQFGSEVISPINASVQQADTSHQPQLPTSSRVFSRVGCSIEFNSAPGDQPKMPSGSKQEQRLFNNFSQKQFQSKTSKSSHTLTNQLSIFKADFGQYDKAPQDQQERLQRRSRQLQQEAQAELKSAPACAIDKTAASFSLQSMTLQNRQPGTSDENFKDELIRQLQAQVQYLQEGTQAKLVESLKRKIKNLQVIIEAQQNFINQVQTHMTKGSVDHEGESGQAINSAFLNSLKNSLNNTLEHQRQLMERDSIPFTQGGVIPDSQLEEPIHYNLERHSGQLLSLPLKNFDQQFQMKSSEQDQFCTLTGVDILPGSSTQENGLLEGGLQGGLPGSDFRENGASFPGQQDFNFDGSKNLFANHRQGTEHSNEVQITTNMSPIRQEYEWHPSTNEGCVPGTPVDELAKFQEEEGWQSRQETMEEANLIDSDEELNDEKNQTTLTDDMRQQISLANSQTSLPPTKIQINLGRDKGKFSIPAALMRNQSAMGLPGMAERNQELQYSKATAHQRNISLSYLNGQQVLTGITPIWEEDLKYQSQASANPQMSSNMNNGSSSIKSFATFQKEQPLPIPDDKEPELPVSELIQHEEIRLSNMKRSSANVTNSPSDIQEHQRRSSDYNQVLSSLTASIKSKSAFQEQRKLALQNSRPVSRRSSPMDSSQGRPPLYYQGPPRQAVEMKESFVDSAFSSNPGAGALAQKYEQLVGGGQQHEPSKFKFEPTPRSQNGHSADQSIYSARRQETSNSCNVIETREDDISLEETCPRLSPELADVHHRPASNFQVIKDKLSSLLSSHDGSCIACAPCQEDLKKRSKIQITNNASGKRGVRAISFIP